MEVFGCELRESIAAGFACIKGYAGCHDADVRNAVGLKQSATTLPPRCAFEAPIA
jgi:hypothetical protein